jgi:hypothetical protein
LLAPK